MFSRCNFTTIMRCDLQRLSSPSSVPIRWVSLLKPGTCLFNFIMTLHLCVQSSEDYERKRKRVFIWTKCLGGPHPSFLDSLSPFGSFYLSMASKGTISHTITKVLQKLQHTDILAEEEDFLVITDEDLEVSVEENKISRYVKILVDKEINIQNIRRCL